MVLSTDTGTLTTVLAHRRDLARLGSPRRTRPRLSVRLRRAVRTHG